MKDFEEFFEEEYGRSSVSVDDVRVQENTFEANEAAGGTVELPEGEYDLTRKQVDFDDGSSTVEYSIEGPEYISVQASLDHDESFTSTDNYEVASTVGDLNKGQIKGLWSNLRELDKDEEELLAGAPSL